ncbi:MAG: PepSY domain-containing protein [Fluviicola sp.]|nr:PepSY domain-containing protein [Fluviicola sp.]
MTSIKNAQRIRKTHRYLGLFLGIQFLFWTISGLYFSWTDIDEIHGDHFKNEEYSPPVFSGLIGMNELTPKTSVSTIQLRSINEQPFYLINGEKLYDAISGKLKNDISEEEALSIAKERMKASMEVKSIELITETDKHHEFRGGPLPSYVISYKGDDEVKAYVAKSSASFITVRHKAWRWFDFLWMTHTMDYEGRDNMNNWLLRAFSILGLITVLSGFVLWFTSSGTVRRIKGGRR